MNHALIDERSRQVDILIAERLRRDPSLLRHAKENLAQWRLTASLNVIPILDEWEALLNGNFDELLQLMVSSDERATRLRQSSPFAGSHFISSDERLELIRKFREASRA
jgi:hypothetical protein